MTTRDIGNSLLSIPQIELMLPEFIEVWNRRPVVSNQNGMTFNHSFATYVIAKTLNFPTIIESGVLRGHSTYILRSACPTAKIYCLDPDLSSIVYKDENANYHTQDFNQIDWSEIQAERSLILFDDHISALQRLLEMKWWGFKHAIFEDNWPTGKGDSYSIRQILDGSGHDYINDTRLETFRVKSVVKEKFFQPVLVRYYYHQHLLRNPNFVDKVSVTRNIESYWEFPPVIRYSINNWKGLWAEPFDAKEPILQLDNDLFFRKLENIEPFRAFHYGYICLITFK